MIKFTRLTCYPSTTRVRTESTPRVRIDSVVHRKRDSSEMDGGPDGFPTFRINGAYDGVPFETLVSIELDGCNVEFETVTGPDFNDFYSAQCELVDKMIDKIRTYGSDLTKPD